MLSTTAVQVHFGMSGAFKALSLPGREATPTTRLTLVNHDLNLIAHLSAMTVLHGDQGASANLLPTWLCIRALAPLVAHLSALPAVLSRHRERMTCESVPGPCMAA